MKSFIRTGHFFICRYKFRAKTLAAGCVFGSIVAVIAFVALSLLRCPPLDIHGVTGTHQGEGASCTDNCNCLGVSYHPVCSADGGTNFFSPCHAGCRTSTKSTSLKASVFEGCQCSEQRIQVLGHEATEPWWKKDMEGRPLLDKENAADWAVDGYCPSPACNRMFFTLLAVLFATALTSATTRVPNMLISLRSIDLKDKPASLALSVAVLSLLAFLPAPVAFGWLMDSACIVWNSKGNCSVYDSDALRTRFGGFAAAAMCLSVIFDVGVWLLVDPDLKLYADDKKKALGDADGMVEIDLNDASDLNRGV